MQARIVWRQLQAAVACSGQSGVHVWECSRGRVWVEHDRLRDQLVRVLTKSAHMTVKPTPLHSSQGSASQRIPAFLVTVALHGYHALQCHHKRKQSVHCTPEHISLIWHVLQNLVFARYYLFTGRTHSLLLTSKFMA